MTPKDIRKQVRNVVQEILPTVLSNEMTISQFRQLQAAVDQRILVIEKNVKDTLHEINERHKDTMGYLVRQVTAPKSEEVTNNEKK